MKEKTQS